MLSTIIQGAILSSLNFQQLHYCDQNIITLCVKTNITLLALDKEDIGCSVTYLLSK